MSAVGSYGRINSNEKLASFLWNDTETFFYCKSSEIAPYGKIKKEFSSDASFVL